MADNEQAMRDLANAYARELTGQLGTLSYFTKQTGETGRIHEHFIRSMFRRFLPPSYLVGSGFVAFKDFTSSQMDVLIYNPDWPVLFSAGDVVVVDGTAAVGALEVKTDMRSADLRSALDACRNLKEAWYRSCELIMTGTEVFYGIYATRGITLPTLIETFHEWVADNLTPGTWGSGKVIPDAILVGDDYACFHDSGLSDPYVAFSFDDPQDKGAALLSVAASVFRCYRITREPWWIQGSQATAIYDAAQRGEPGRTLIKWSPTWPEPAAK